MGYMYKFLILPIVMTALFADGGAVGATARGGRSIANATATTETTKSSDNSAASETQAVAARAANRARVKSAPTNTVTTARVATRTAARSAKTPTVSPATTQTKTSGGVAARAGVKQKAVNMGTKITTATENTVIPEECRTAFDGCMDSFCMLENTSGGRCRCDDRSEELDNVLDQIMKLDAQSKTLAEEGVERLQRGDAVDAIYSMAEDAANKVVADQKKNQKNFLDVESKTKSNKLDLSLFDAGVFDTDELFGDSESDGVLGSDFSDKKGSALRSAATKMCVTKVPAQCKEYSSMLQLVYAQKIKSDCMAYENDLKKQKMNSETLLKTAQKAVRDAAAEAYEAKNKYDLGQCVMAFKQCMLGEEVCGSGFSKCVVDPSLISNKSSKPYTIQTAKSISVEINASTYSALEGSRGFCDSVLKQCVDANKNDAVWKQFLINVAPELKGAEYAAQDDASRNCARNVLTCIKEQAAEEGHTEGSDSWYIFTSNPDNVKKLCPGELRKCSAYDNEMEYVVMKFVNLSLNALRADRCTATIKKCLTDACGTDYSTCLGYTVADLKAYCPRDVIEVDCAGYNEQYGDIYKYVDNVAAGLLLNVDDALSKGCLNAVNTAMATYCGSDTTSCTNSSLDFSAVLNKYLTYKLFGECDKDGNCKTKNSISEFSASDGLSCPKWVAGVNYDGLSNAINSISVAAGTNTFSLGSIAMQDTSSRATTITDTTDTGTTGTFTAQIRPIKFQRIDINLPKLTLVNNLPRINIADNVAGLTPDRAFTAKPGSTAAVRAVVDKMNAVYKNIVGNIRSNSTVSDCINGKVNFGLDGKAYKSKYKQGDVNIAFKNLTNNIYSTVAQSVYDTFVSQYNARVEELQPDIDAANEQINKIYSDAGVVCDGDNKIAGNSGGNDAQDDKDCKIGHCNDCGTAEGKCKCIAKTYFQHGPIKHHYYDKWEKVVLASNIATYSASNKTCTILHRRFRSCSGDPASCSWATDNNDRAITFTLDKDTEISISNCVFRDYKEDNDYDAEAYKDTLTIGSQKIDFINCSKTYNEDKWPFLTNLNDYTQIPFRGDGACYWCWLDSPEKDASNSTYIKKGEKTVPSTNPYFGEQDW